MMLDYERLVCENFITQREHSDNHILEIYLRPLHEAFNCTLRIICRSRLKSRKEGSKVRWNEVDINFCTYCKVVQSQYAYSKRKLIILGTMS